MIKVSLIIPIFNAQSYLEACLNSAINQSLRDIEIICVNDGSHDNSFKILSEFVQKDERIKVINQSNQGLSVSRNNAIRIAKGEYLAFLDSDDTLELEALELMYENARQNRSDIGVTQPKKIDKEGNISINAFPNLDENHFENILNPNFSVSVCTKLFKKDLFESTGVMFPEGYYYEDHITSIQLFFYAKRVSYLNEAVYNYYERDNSITTSLSQKKIDDIFQVIKDMEDFFHEKNLSYNDAILRKLVKLLSLYVLVQLRNMKEDKLTGYFTKKLFETQCLNEKTLQNLKTTMFGLYIDFFKKLIELDVNKNYEMQVVLRKFPLKEVNTLQSLLKNRGEINYPLLIIDYLKKHKTNSLVIYGAGQGFFDLVPLLKSNNIEIIAVTDKNINNLKSIGENYITLDMNENNEQMCNQNVLITSIAFCTEITEGLIQYSETYGIKFNIIDIRSVLKG